MEKPQKLIIFHPITGRRIAVFDLPAAAFVGTVDQATAAMIRIEADYMKRAVKKKSR